MADQKTKDTKIIASLSCLLTIELALIVTLALFAYNSPPNSEIIEASTPSAAVQEPLQPPDKTEEPPAAQNEPKIQQFNIIIDKLGISAPVIKNVEGSSKEAYTAALNEGVAHYQGTALPGQGSNIFIFAHSSTITGQEKYARVFSTLNNLEEGDKILIQYNDKEFQYSVTKKVIVAKDDTSVLQPTPGEQLSLMTCWPVNTNQKRLIVIADLVSERIISNR